MEPTGLARRQEKGLRFSGFERFGQDEEAVHAVDQAERAGDPEGQARVDAAEDAAEGRAEDEAHAERGAEHAEGSGALFVRGDIGHVGHGRWHARRRQARDDATEEEPAERRGEGHDDVVEAEAEVREQDDGPAAVAVGE